MNKEKITAMSEHILDSLAPAQDEIQANNEELAVALLTVLGGITIQTSFELTQDEEELDTLVKVATSHYASYLFSITSQMLAQQKAKGV